YRGKLNDIPRITRTEGQTFPPVHNRPPQAQGHGSDSVSIAHGWNRIEIVRSHDARKIRIKPLPVLRTVDRANHLLHDDRHLFFFQPVGSSPHVPLGMLAEGGSVDALDS